MGLGGLSEEGGEEIDDLEDWAVDRAGSRRRSSMTGRMREVGINIVQGIRRVVWIRWLLMGSRESWSEVLRGGHSIAVRLCMRGRGKKLTRVVFAAAAVFHSKR